MSNEADTKKSRRNVLVCAAALAAAMTMGWCAAMATLDRADKGSAAAQSAASAPAPVPSVAKSVALPAPPPAPPPVLVTNVATPAPEVALAPAPPPLETAQKPRAPRPATRRAPRVASLPALPRPICTDERGCDTTDLQRCLAHDGDGCANVGRYYEVDRADPFSAITWYRKGCELSNGPACNALDRVKGARPREGTLRDDPLAASMPVMAADSPKTATKL